MKQQDKNIHAMHRERMREKIKKHGIQTLADHELVEVALFNAIPRCNTNPIAHNLIKQCDGLVGLFNTNLNKLLTIDGIGENAAIFLMTLGELYKRTSQENISAKRLNTIASESEFCIKLFEEAKTEKIYALCLDKHMYFISAVEINITSENTEAKIDVKNTIRKIAEFNSEYIILTHNHVTDSLKISKADATFTINMLKLFRLCNIQLLDHIIVNNKKFLSFKEEGYLDNIINLANGPKLSDSEISYRLGLSDRVKSDTIYYDPELDSML